LLNIEKWLKDGWTLYKDNWQNFLGAYAIYTLIGLLAQKTGPLLLFIMPPFFGSLFIITFQCIRTKNIDMKEMLTGLYYYNPLLLVSTLVGILSFMGFMLFIIPGIIISVLYLFAVPLIIDGKLNFWEAMEVSRKKVMENLGGYLIFGLLLMALIVLGAITMGVGILITMPIAINTLCFAYLDVFEEVEK